VLDSLTGEMVEMTSPVTLKHYLCVLPPDTQDSANAESGGEQVSIPELLEPLGTSCLYRVCLILHISL
jgi:hypothetical protein